MPKKRTYNLKQFHGTSSTPSKPTSKDGDDTGASVNQRLSELRKIEGKEAVLKKREFAASVNQRSVPPTLQGILGVPESAPPKPKRGVRPRTGHRPTPGPAAPKSWVNRTTPTLALRGRRRGLTQSASRIKNVVDLRDLLRFARLVNDDAGIATDPLPGLMRSALKMAANQWQMFEEEDLPALSELPLRVRLLLIVYLGFYGPAIDITTLDALTKGEGRIETLDLSGVLTHGTIGLSQLTKLLKAETYAPIKVSETTSVLDSWDQDETIETTLTINPSFGRFADVTQLCLSHPPPNAHWRDLLAFSKYTPRVTHLSLAYWPRPTLTPNLVTTTVDGPPRQEISARGSSFYSELDSNFSEPLALLRQLSGNLLYLQWLDLEGCSGWMPALAVSAEEVVAAQSRVNAVEESWSLGSAANSFLLSNWKNLRLIRVDQGWRPEMISVEFLHPTPMSKSRQYRQAMQRHIDSIKNDETKPLHELDEAHYETGSQDDRLIRQRQARIWVENEEQMMLAGARVNYLRRLGACKLITFDHGWTKEKVSVTEGL